jgi:hypothetical protein
MSAELVTIRTIERPKFRNENLGISRRRWFYDNSAVLARYWAAQGNALSLSPEDDEELDCWLNVQYDIELGQVRLSMEVA